MQEEGIGLDSLPGQASKNGKGYNVKVTTRSQLGRSVQGTHSGQSEEDFASKGDADSLDDILPMQGRGEKGITKTVNISVER